MHLWHSSKASRRFSGNSRKRSSPTLIVSIRQHTSAYVSIRQQPQALPAYTHRQHTSAYVSKRQHTSAYARKTLAYVRMRQHTQAPHLDSSTSLHPKCWRLSQAAWRRWNRGQTVSIRQQTSAYVSIRQQTSACVSIPGAGGIEAKHCFVRSLDKTPHDSPDDKTTAVAL
jgi:hypothetical protein